LRLYYALRILAIVVFPLPGGPFKTQYLTLSDISYYKGTSILGEILF